jgi:hypothetical protein
LKLEAVKDDAIELIHGFELETVKQRAHLFPESFLRADFFENGLEKGATESQGLIDQECEHHDLHKDHAEVLLSEAVVVLEVVALVFQGVEGLIFDLPPGAARPHDATNIGLGDGNVGDPGEPDLFIASHLPVFEEVDPDVLVGCIDGDSVHPVKVVKSIAVMRILEDEIITCPPLASLIELSEEMNVVALLDAENEMVAQVLNEADERAVGADGIMGDDDLEMGVLRLELREKPPAGVEPIVVFCRPILLGDDLRNEGNDFLALQMNDGCTDRLEVTGSLAPGGLLLETLI